MDFGAYLLHYSVAPSRAMVPSTSHGKLRSPYLNSAAHPGRSLPWACQPFVVWWMAHCQPSGSTPLSRWGCHPHRRVRGGGGIFAFLLTPFPILFTSLSSGKLTFSLCLFLSVLSWTPQILGGPCLHCLLAPFSILFPSLSSDKLTFSLYLFLSQSCRELRRSWMALVCIVLPRVGLGLPIATCFAVVEVPFFPHGRYGVWHYGRWCIHTLSTIIEENFIYWQSLIRH
jgi:hypothetical protein